MSAKTSAAVKNKWNRANYDRIEIFVPKGKKDCIRAYSENCGESMNAFINRAIDEIMERQPTSTNVNHSGATWDFTALEEELAAFELSKKETE